MRANSKRRICRFLYLSDCYVSARDILKYLKEANPKYKEHPSTTGIANFLRVLHHHGIVTYRPAKPNRRPYYIPGSWKLTSPTWRVWEIEKELGVFRRGL